MEGVTQMRYILKDADRPLLEFSANMQSSEADLQIQKIHEENRAFLPLNLALTNEGVERWLKHRTIPKNRAYVDALLSKTGLSINRPLGIIAVCKGLSLNDCYWVDQADDQTTFEKVNLYENRFSQVLASIAFTGYGSSVRTSLLTSRNFPPTDAAQVLAAGAGQDLPVQGRHLRLQQYRL